MTLRGNVGERPLEFELPMMQFNKMAAEDSCPLHRLAAKSQIKLLEDKESAEEGGQSIMGSVEGTWANLEGGIANQSGLQ